ncbi:MAG: oxidoreductase [Spirochaetia bacterium]|jgi:predicted dehydrogenase|nr:oxidoreductase [Spirochaetia bacterium]
MDKPIGVGLIGFGMAGRVFHAPVIACVPELKLAKIVTGKTEAASLAASKYPDTEVVSDYKKLFEDDQISLIVVATPNTSHAKLASEALEAGKHVVVEKPFTVTSSDADDLIRLAEKRKRILTVHQNRRWDSDFQTVKKVIENKLIGNIAEYEAHYDRFRNRIKENAWREVNQPGSGMVYDLGSHLIDQALSLFGLPESVTADIRTQRRGGPVDDAFEIILHYKGLKVTLKSGMLVREPLPRYIILGDKGSFVKYGTDVQEEALKMGKSPADDENWGSEPESIWGVLNTEIEGLNFRGKIESIKGDYRKFYKNTADSVSGRESPVVSAQDGRNTIRIIELAFESSRAGRTMAFKQ